jgi:hypothetical protein
VTGTFTRTRTLALVMMLGASGCASWISSDVRLHDDFRSYPLDWKGTDGSRVGPWTVRFAGYGSVEVSHVTGGGKAMRLSTLPSVRRDETHAAMVIGPEFAGPYDLQVALVTERQLRLNDPPNPWEVAWLVWQYTDDAHFYYFIAKPNGWELGKRDPAYPGGQRFLASGTSPQFPIGSWYNVHLRVEQPGHNSVWVDNARIADFDDSERPYDHGRIGFYLEDAVAAFGNVQLR